jgi:hypothetical protein
MVAMTIIASKNIALCSAGPGERPGFFCVGVSLAMEFDTSTVESTANRAMR